MTPSISTKKISRSLRTIFPASAYTAEQLQYLEEAAATGRNVEELITLDPWRLEARITVERTQAVAA
jgi:hypothetical protein